VHDVGARDAAEPTRALSLADEFPGMPFPSPSSTQTAWAYLNPWAVDRRNNRKPECNLAAC
jgi:hypothetical protein